MIYTRINGVPDFECREYDNRKKKYCLLIPVLNEKGRIEPELERAKENNIHEVCDIIILDGGSKDGCNNDEALKSLGVNTLLIKTGSGKQGAQLRMGFFYALKRGYEGFITVDGNNKDSIEDTVNFIEKLEEGYDFVQGSRYIDGGVEENTPILRKIGVKYIHSPLISKAAGYKFTDTTNAFRGYSKKYIEDESVSVFRDVFSGYELLAYLSVRAAQLKMKVIEIPVKRSYPKGEKVPTKISPLKGNLDLLKILFKTARGKYTPDK